MEQPFDRFDKLTGAKLRAGERGDTGGVLECWNIGVLGLQVPIHRDVTWRGSKSITPLWERGGLKQGARRVERVLLLRKFGALKALIHRSPIGNAWGMGVNGNDRTLKACLTRRRVR